MPSTLIIPINQLHRKSSYISNYHRNHYQHKSIKESIEDVKEGFELKPEECLECGKFFGKEILDYAENGNF